MGFTEDEVLRLARRVQQHHGAYIPHKDTDECFFCGAFISDREDVPVEHDADCVVLIANDILTGYPMEGADD